MADTIRDVIIRIGIQQRDANLVTPDFSAWTKAAEDAVARMQAEFAKVKVPTASGAVSSGPIPSASEAVLGSGPLSAPVSKPQGKSNRPTREGIEEAKRGLAEIDAVYEQLRENSNNFATEIDKIGAREIESMRAKVAEEIRLQEQRLAALESAEEKMKQVRRSASNDKLNAYKRDNSADVQSAFDKVTEALQKNGNKSSGIESAEKSLKVLDEAVARSEAQAKRWGTAEAKATADTVRGMRDSAAAAIESAKAKNTEAEAVKRSEDAKKKEAAAEQKRQTQINTAVEAVRSTGEGFFRSLRGAALVFSDTSDGYEKLLANIRYIQGAWDIASGSLQVMKGGMRAFSVVQIAATAAGGYYALAMKGVSIAQTAVAATAAAASAGVRTLVGAMGGPVVATVLAVTAVLAAGSVAMASYGTTAKEAGDDVGNLVSKGRLLREVIGVLNASKLEVDFAGEVAKLNDMLPAAEKLANIDRQRLLVVNQMAEAAKALPGGMETMTDKDQLQGALSLIRMQEGLAKESLSLEKERVSILRDQQSELQKNVEKQSQLLAKVQATAAEERKRVESIQETVGRLNEIERIELKRLLDKKKSGQELSRPEFERLGQIGGQLGQEANRQSLVKEGEKSGLAELLSQVLTGRNLTGNGSALQDSERSVRAQTSLMANAEKERDKRAKELGEAIQKSFDKSGNILEYMYKVVFQGQQMLERRIENMDKNNHETQVGHRRNY